MSNFICEKCNTYCQDGPRGYVTGCEHYPPDRPLRGFGVSFVNGSARNWYYDKFGVQRWVDNDSLFSPPPNEKSPDAGAKGKPMTNRPHHPDCFCYACEEWDRTTARAAKEQAEARRSAADCSPEEWWAKRAAEISLLMKNTGVGELLIRRKADGKYTFEVTPEAGPHSA